MQRLRCLNVPLLGLLLARAGLAIASCTIGSINITKFAGCKRFWVNSSIPSSCFGVNSSAQQAGAPGQLLEVRAVHYTPRPVGLPAFGVDLYTSEYQSFHNRDLFIISNVLHANTVRIDPWDSSQDHSNFLKLCKSYGLWVIPSFHLRDYFLSTDQGNAVTDSSQVITEFTSLVRSVSMSDPILGWTVNYALPLSTDTLYSPMNSNRDLYFALIQALRNVLVQQEWNLAAKPNQFLRPLMLPLDMMSGKKDSDVCTFIQNTETQWLATWPQQALLTDGSTYTLLKSLGAFDVWIPEMFPSSTLEEAQKVNTWLKQLSLNNCSYATSKAVLASFGFPALLPPGIETQVPRPHYQQSLLQYAWDHFRPAQATASTPCTVGGIVEGWVDDWNRCAQSGFASDNKWSQSQHSQCDVPQNGRYNYVEWLGLTSQYSFMGFHCISPRFLPTDPSDPNDTAAICNPSFAEEDPNTTGAFRFDPLDRSNQTSCSNQLSSDFSLLQSSGHQQNLCQLLWPLTPVYLLFSGPIIFALVAFGLRNELYQTFKKYRAARSAEGREAELGESLMQPEAQEDPNMQRERRSSVSSMEAGGPEEGAVKVTTSSWPAAFPKAATEAQATTAEFVIELKFSKQEEDTAAEVRQNEKHLAEHVNAQAWRLEHQIRSEANAVLAGGFLPQSADSAEPKGEHYQLAMRNIHLRALEGYIVWLADRLERPSGQYEESQRWLNEVYEGAAFCPGLPSAQRYTEVLLLRVVESLAEHALHSPEFVALAYHQARQTGPDYTIDLDFLHKGIYQLMESPNPFLGGINFDDINDFGWAGDAEATAEIPKSYYESTSIQVLLDVLYNFQPVFVIKAWIFFVACYIHLGVDVQFLLSKVGLLQGAPPQSSLMVNGIAVEPKSQRILCVEVFVCFESIFALLAEILILFRAVQQFGGLCSLQRVCASLTSKQRRWWLLRRLVSLLVSAACIGMTVGVWKAIWPTLTATYQTLAQKDVQKQNDDAQAEALPMAQIALALRAVTIVLTNLLRFEAHLLPGQPSKLRKPDVAATYELYEGSSAVLAGSHHGSSHHAGSHNLGSSPELSEVMQRSVSGTSSANGRSTTAAEEITLKAWAVMLFASLLFEVYVVVPFALDFTFTTFCGDYCSAKLARGQNIFGLSSVVGSHCVACTGALLLIWVLVALVSMFDLYIIFYVGTGFFGYIIGTRRHLGNLMSMALRYLDFQIYTREVHKTGVMKLRDGEAMERVFGKGWRKVWSRIVEALYDEHLISNVLAEEMIKAAKTHRWSKVMRPSKHSAPPAPSALPCQPAAPASAEPTAEPSKDSAPPDAAPSASLLPGSTWEASEGALGTFNLQKAAPMVRERVSFFMASLRSVGRVAPGRTTLLDSHIGSIPSLTQIISCRDEDIILSEKALRASDSVNSNLGYIVAQHLQEWQLFTEWLQVAPLPEDDDHDWEEEDEEEKEEEDEDEKKIGKYESASGLFQRFLDGVRQTLSEDQKMEVRLWASRRSRTVARSVLGALAYHEVLGMIPGVGAAKVDDCAEVLLTMEAFGLAAKEEEEEYQRRDGDVLYLMARLASKKHLGLAQDVDQALPFYLVFDFDRDTASAAICIAVDKAIDPKFSTKVQRASVLAKCREGYVLDSSKWTEDERLCPKWLPRMLEEVLEIVRVLPRKFPPRVGKGAFMTQREAAAELGALRFARGHVVQVMDTTMGVFLGEACKVPFVTRLFHPEGKDRAAVQMRVVGFREFLFTKRFSEVGCIMAASEWSIGTICQRFLHGIGGRTQCGKPDFVDGFWASNRGSLSKASPVINSSADLFAGFNVRMRSEVNMHVDTLAWEKSREGSFNAAAGLFTKAGAGSVGVLRSRDLKVITGSLSAMQSFSLFFASVGFYMYNFLLDLSIFTYVWCFTLLTLASKTLSDATSLQTVLAGQWIASIGIISMFPRLMELVLECGPLEGVFEFLPTIPGCLTMFTFVNKSIASSVHDAMVTGKEAPEAPRGSHANKHYSWCSSYQQHCLSHFYPALQTLIWILVYMVLAGAEEFSTLLPMFLLILMAFLWLTAPVIFCPQHTVENISKDLGEFWQFIVAPPKYSHIEHRKEVERNLRRETEMANGELSQLKVKALQTSEEVCRSYFKGVGQAGTLYDFWLIHQFEHKKSSVRWRVVSILAQIFRLVLIAAVVPATMLDNWALTVLLPLVNFALMEIWRATDKAPAVMLLTLMTWWVLPLVVWQLTFVNYVMLMAVILLGLKALRDILLLLAWLFQALRYRQWPVVDWPEWLKGSRSPAECEEKLKAANQMLYYDQCVVYLYSNLSEHLFHVYAGILMLLTNLAVSVLLMGLDAAYGLHSWYLLSARLRSTGLFQQRVAFEPPKAS